MRLFTLLFILTITSCFFQSCGNKQEAVVEVKKKFIEGSNSFELLMFDTINKIDANGFKQGKWIVRKLPGNIVIESGMYINNQKQGCWVRHGLKGEFIDSIYYEKDIPKN